jgi:hypothetical protein
MWYELVVIIGAELAELVVLVAIAAMNLHNRRKDVLRGRYSAAELYCATSPGRNIDWSRRRIGRERAARPINRQQMPTQVPTSVTNKLGVRASMAAARHPDNASQDQWRSLGSQVTDEIELDYHATCAIGSRSRLVARTTGRS